MLQITKLSKTITQEKFPPLFLFLNKCTPDFVATSSWWATQWKTDSHKDHVQHFQ